MLLFVSVFSQNEQDALRYSFIQGGGTARYMAMGGAYGAIGADMSAASTNPAGLGRYSKSEFVFTPGFNLVENSTNYNGTNAFNSNSSVNFTNFGYVGTMVNDKPDMSPWKTVQVGIVYNKLNNYNYSSRITGDSPSSITHYMANRANGYTVEDNLVGDAFYSGLFIDGEMIYEDPNQANTYYSYIETDVTQNKDIIRSGQLGETTISVSGNYDDMLYVGGSIGFQKVKYFQESTYSENIIDQSKSLITDMAYTETLYTTGNGYNIKLGTLYLPMDWLRLGVAYHTRTAMSLRDVYTSTLNSNDTTGYFAEVYSPDGNFDYRIKTPSKTLFSAAVVLKKRAIISADYEFYDLSKSLLKATSYDFKTENSLIQTIYQATNAFKMGAEFKVNDFFVLRGGFAVYSSPIKKEFVATTPNRQTISFGGGYRRNNFFWDVAISSTQWKEDYFVYDPNLVDAAQTKYGQIQFINTFGFRF